jgi:hypothetical protein
VAGERRSDHAPGVRRGTGDWRRALPTSWGGRALLAIGALTLLAVIPLLWMWLRYGSGLSEPAVVLGAITLTAFTVGTGAAMIRALDGGS